MSDDRDNKETTPKRKPLPSDPWLNEGGTARYPEGFKIRGVDVNKYRDEAARETVETEKQLAAAAKAREAKLAAITLDPEDTEAPED